MNIGCNFGLSSLKFPCRLRIIWLFEFENYCYGATTQVFNTNLNPPLFLLLKFTLVQDFLFPFLTSLCCVVLWDVIMYLDVCVSGWKKEYTKNGTQCLLYLLETLQLKIINNTFNIKCINSFQVVIRICAWNMNKQHLSF